jgi:hypothetical protein
VRFHVFSVRRELEAVVQRQVTARVQADRDADDARARVAAIARNLALLQALQAEREGIYAGSLVYGGHGVQYHQGESNFFKKKRKHHWTCSCGLYQYGGNRPGGSCPNNRSYSQPTWDAWAAQAKADGSWQRVLSERGYDFSVEG